MVSKLIQHQDIFYDEFNKNKFNDVGVGVFFPINLIKIR